LARMMRAARKRGVRVECRPLLEERHCFEEYLEDAAPPPLARSPTR
jgi:hypothetical protein